METHLYLSLIPEALIFSQLTPPQFGKYLSIGAKRLTRGPAVFFEIDPAFTTDAFHVEAARAKCVPHPDGTPRRSCYASVYQVLAHTPISVLRDLYLTTADGLTLQLGRQAYEKPNEPGLHLYQEICPVQPRVASPLDPEDFAAFVTNPENPVFLPRLAFCELRLDGLARDPERSSADNLPYRNVNHLRECLTALKYKTDKLTKIVMRDMEADRVFPVMTNGFFVGDQEELAYYPLPSADAQATEYHRWFNSATRTARY